MVKWKVLVLLLLVSLVKRQKTTAQNLVLIDSLHFELKNAQGDSAKAFYHSEIGYNWCGVQFDSAWYHAKKAHSFALQSKSPEMIRLGLTAMGWAHDWNYNFDSAIYYYDKAYIFSKENADEKGIATSLFNIGVTHYQQGKLDSALNYYLLSEPIFESLGDLNNLSRLYNNMGRIYEKTKHHELALEVSKKSIEIKLVSKNIKGLLNSYTNMSSIFQKMEQYDSALVYSKKCITLAKEVNDISSYKHELVNLGIIYKNLNQGNESIKFYQEAESLIKENEDPYFLLQIYLNLGEFYYSEKQFNKTLSYLRKMRSKLLDDDYIEMAIHYYQLAYSYYKAVGNYEASIENLEKYMRLNEKFLSQKTIEKTTELEQLYKKEKRESEITKLNLLNENQKAQIAERNNQRIIYISTIVFSLMLASFIYYRYQSKAKTSKLLEEKNSIISTALDERETLLKEIHHRVKNNLQIISSLLNLQSKHIDDESAIEAVKEGRNRVKSMAMIHQKLYQEDNLTGVTISDYINNLARSLFNSYGVNEEQIVLKTDIDDLNLDIDTTIPLGLILNELITNSLKYAFPDNQSGELLISLKKSQDKLYLLISDNGIGMAQEEHSKNDKSFGLKLVNSLARKLKATVEIDNTSGTSVTLQISNFKMA